MSKISELSDGGALQSTDYLIAVRSGGNVKVQPAGMTFSSATFTTVDINGGTIDGVTIGGSSAGAGSFTTLTASGDVNFDSGTFFVDASADAVGIGTSSPVGKLHVQVSSTGINANSNFRNLVLEESGNVGLTLLSANTSLGSIVFGDSDSATVGRVQYQHSDNSLQFFCNGSEAMRIDSSGNLLVGTTNTAPGIGNTDAGVAIRGGSDNRSFFSVSSNYVAAFSRNTDDGDIAIFRKDNATVGSIGAQGGYLTIGQSGTTDAFLSFTGVSQAAIRPASSTGANSDNTTDLGATSARFTDIYATNGTIQTSDVNEKENIRELLEAEARVAQAAKGLLRAFQWKDSVAEKGEDARIHFGIIAQDLQAAFEAEGLDAGRYAMFIHSTWTDEETGEERSRMGVRYSELLAFIIAAL